MNPIRRTRILILRDDPAEGRHASSAEQATIQPSRHSRRRPRLRRVMPPPPIRYSGRRVGAILAEHVLGGNAVDVTVDVDDIRCSSKRPDNQAILQQCPWAYQHPACLSSNRDLSQIIR